VLGKDGGLALEDPAASSRHCEVGFDGRGWIVVDLRSTNGTWVEGRRVDGPTYLTSGQILQVGHTRLRFTT
jgi:pSer/pThr/pTyr-binding forkhead associated (FHA) protein